MRPPLPTPFARLRAFTVTLVLLYSVVTAQAFAAAPTTTTLAVSSNNVVAGTVVTLTATVTNPGTVTSGTVNFCNTSSMDCSLGSGLYATAQLTSAGTAVVHKAFGYGVNNIKAVFLPTTANAGSTSLTDSVSVSASPIFASFTNLGAGGGVGNYTLSGSVAAFGSQSLSGIVDFLDTSNSNIQIGASSFGAVLSSFFPQTALTTGVHPTSVAVGDFNGDGKLDFATANHTGNSVSVFLGKGDGTFQSPVTYSPGSYPICITAADINNDGKLDLVLSYASNGSTVAVLLGNGDGTFQAPRTYSVGASPQAVAVGDFNGDGNLDIATANESSNNISVLLGNGDGTFQPQVTYPTGALPVSIEAGDFNGDGKLDLVVANMSGNSISVLLGNGDGTFQAGVAYSVGAYPSSVAVGDFNGDGKLDLITSNNNDSTISLLLGNGDGTFQASVPYAVGNGPQNVAVGDFNGDGNLDLAAVNMSAGTLSVLLGNGNGSFRSQVTYPTGSFPYALAVGDFNGDGQLDIATANEGGNSVTVFLGEQIGSYSQSGISVSGSGTHNILASYVGDSSRTSSQSSTLALTASTPQTISFATISPTYYGVGYVTLSATGGASGNPVVFSVVSGPAYISYGNWLEITGVGTVVVAADQAGNSSYAAAPEVTQNVIVNKASQTIAFNLMPSVTYGVGPITLSPVVSSGGLVVVYSVLSGPGTISGNILTVTGAGTIVIAADQPGNDYVSPATEVTQSLQVLQAGQTLTVGTYPTSVTYGVFPITLSGSSTSGLPVAFTILGGPGSLTGNTLTVTASGTIWLEAVQAGNANYLNGVSTSFSISVFKATPSISVVSSGTPSAYGATVTFTATLPGGTTGAVYFYDGGTAVAEGIVSNGIAVGSTSALGVGSHTITASYHGNLNYNAVLSSAIVQVVSPQPQSITFAQLQSTVAAGDWLIALSATSTSYLPVIFRVLSGPGTVVGNTLTVTGLGPVVVAADQAGNSQYTAAPEVTQTITGVSGITLAGMVGIVPGSINTIAGSVNWANNYLTDGSVVTSTFLTQIYGLAPALNGDYYLSTQEGFIWRVSASTGVLSTVAGCDGSSGPCNWLQPGQSGPGLQNGFSYARGVVVDGNQNLDFTDGGTNVYQLNTHTGTLTNLGPQMDDPTGAIAVDSAGNIYAGDDVNIVWKWTAQTQTWSIFAGAEWTDGNSGDGGQAAGAQIGYPASLAVDNAGNLYIGDTEYNVIRKVDTTTGIITTIAGTTVAGYSGDGGQATAAQIGQVSGLATDQAGILYLTDSTYNVVRQIIPSTGIITTIAGNGAAAYTGDGGSATSASLSSPTIMMIDNYGNLYIADQTGDVIREIGPSGSLGFGSVSVGVHSSASSVTIENRGVSTIQFSADPSFTGDFSAAGGNTCGKANSTLAVGATCAIPVVFTPSAPGTRTGTLTLADNGMSTSQEVTLSGTGVTATPSISVSCSPNPITYGPQTTTCTATVGDGATGTLQWTINGGAWTTTTLSGGSSSAGLGAGTIAGSHTIDVTYSGDSYNNPASASTTLTINKMNTVTTGSLTANPITFGQAYFFSGHVDCNSNCGSVQYVMDGAVWYTDSLDSSGNYSTGYGSAPAGTHSIQVNYLGDSNHDPSSWGPVTLTVNKSPTVTEISSTVNPISHGGSTTFTALVDTGGSVVSGTAQVAFTSNGASIGSATVSTVTTTNLLPFSQDLTGSTWTGYCGSLANMTQNTSDLMAPDGTATAAKFVVPGSICGGGGSNGVLIGGLPNGLTAGQTYTNSVWLRGAAGGETVNFGLNDCAMIGVTLTSSWKRYTVTWPTISTGTATCEGGRGFQVLGANETYYMWGAQAEQSATAGPYVATVSNPVSGNGGIATLTTTTLATGSDSIVATYSGDANTLTSASNPLIETVTKATATMSLTSSLNPSNYGDAVTFTVTATGVAGLGNPSGTVTVSDGGTTLATVTLDASGTATKTIQTLAVGTHSLSAVYGGDANYK
jgi:Bacterial Ig-like domain (group 3)/FG-GAP-like repeat